VAETPLAKLSRVLGGVALGYGPLGHQALGQLLILNTNEVEVAAASVLLSAVARQHDAALQASVRVLVPAIAVHLITRRNEETLTRLARVLDRRAEALDAREQRLDARERGGRSARAREAHLPRNRRPGRPGPG
jgi:hypothetical protein